MSAGLPAETAIREAAPASPCVAIDSAPPRVQVSRREESTPDTGSFAELADQVRQANLWQLAAWRPAARTALVTAAFAAGWAALVIVGDSWYQLIVAAYLAGVFTQIAFLGHAAGHRQLFGTPALNRRVGLVMADLVSGISWGYWVDKHDRHHRHPNLVGADPDVGPGVISWTPEQSSAKSGLSRALSRHQAVAFFPLLLLEGLSLRVSSIMALRTAAVRRTVAETTMMVVHALAYFGVIFWVLSPLRALVFIAVQQGLFGFYLGCSFVPNHTGMAMPSPDEKLDFLRRQVTTARNVTGRRLLDTAMGNLNYQIEHHLFPTLPMANLRRCQPIVQAYCVRHEIAYCQDSVTGSFGAALRHLRLAGRPAAT